jgi:hypothetical protein
MGMTRMAPHIMTWGQVLAYASVEVQRRVARLLGKQPPPRYAPCFARGVQHFLLHAGEWLSAVLSLLLGISTSL